MSISQPLTQHKTTNTSIGSYIQPSMIPPAMMTIPEVDLLENISI